MANIAPVTPLAAKPPVSALSRKTTRLASPRHHKVWACASHLDQTTHVRRRNVALGLAGMVLGLSVDGDNAKAAPRRPPPPPEEKKDPNVSGVMAKVLASKKRKEAMKESMAKLREKGKPPQ